VDLAGKDRRGEAPLARHGDRSRLDSPEGLVGHGSALIAVGLRDGKSSDEHLD
jgi:hypothetical protein